MLPDSGANDFMVESTLLPPSSQTSPWLYNPNASTTAAQLPAHSYSECYGSGFCDNGVVFTDVVSFGGIAFSDVSLMVQTYNNDISPPFQTGNLGLNHDPLQSTSPKDIASFAYALEPYLDSHVYTLDYNRFTEQGTFDFGYIDKAKYTGNLAYAPIDESGGEWTVSVAGIYTKTGYVSYAYDIIVDSGTGGFGDWHVPPAVAAAYFATVPGAHIYADNGSFGGQGSWIYPCDSDLPDLVIVFGSQNVTIPGVYLESGYSTTDPDYPGYCQTNFNGYGGSDASPYMHGESFIESLFLVFDYDNARVGFASKTTSSPPGTPTVPPVTATATPTGTATPPPNAISSVSSSCIILAASY
jgi:aspergillopepsin I